jgi:cytidylate kinase
MKPCVVLSREMGSEGDLVAHEASDLTGYRVFHTEAIGKLARRHGLRGSEWRWLDQGWHRLFAHLEDRPEVHLTAVRRVLIEACGDRRGALFLGRGIGELLHGQAPLLRVHVVAPFDVRAERIMQQVSVMRSRAEERVRGSDEENAWFYRYFFQANWSDPARYDLILDSSVLTPNECAQRLVKAMARLTETPDPVRGGRAR